ncbi:hypothetical protein Tco_0316771 [Tanacetum coccineum]
MIVMENPNHPNEPNEDIPEENPVIPEPNHVEDAHDPNEMVDIPDDEELVDYDGDNEEEPKEEPEEEPEPNNGHGNQFAQHPNLIARESSFCRDKSYVGGLAPWAFRRDLETSRARARLTEAELGTCQTEIALLKSKNKIGEKERELLDHDLGDVELTLGNVLERLKVLESRENTTLKKRLTETETKLAWACMERDIAEGGCTERERNRRLLTSRWDRCDLPEPRVTLVTHSILVLSFKEQVATSMAEFMANINRGAGGAGAGGAGAGGAGTGGVGAGGAEA